MLRIDWVAIGSIGTFVGVFVAAGAIFYQGYLARRAARLDNIWRLVAYWDSDKMWMMRAKAAREIKKRKPAEDMADLLGFFEHIGYLLRKRWIDTESAWVMFSDWALPYWQAAKYAIEEDQRKDPTLWVEFGYLNDHLVEFDKKKRTAPGRPYAGVTAKDIDGLIDGELALSPGRLRWREWW